MSHRLEVFADAAGVAEAGARFVTEIGARSIAERGSFHFAVSGGTTPWAMFALLRAGELRWDRVTLYQVDERIAPIDDAGRNLTNLRASLGGTGARIVAMPVDDSDLEAGAQRYARELPGEFDLVHLGLGADGHTASLVPGDAVLDVVDRRVAVTAGPYQGRRRMTLTFPALAATRQTLWLVTGADKRAALGRLLAGDETIPAARVRVTESVVYADADAVTSNRRGG